MSNPKKQPDGPIPGGWGWSYLLLFIVAIATGLQMLWQAVSWPFRKIRDQFDTD